MLILAGLVFALLQSPSDSSVRSNLSIKGTITDSAGGLIPGVLVLIKSGQLLDWTITDEAGRYQLANLKSAQYELIVTFPDLASRKRSLNLTTPTTQDEVLEAAAKTCVCVTGMSPSSDQLRAAAERLRQVALRMEDLRPGADLDAQRTQLLSDFRSFGNWAIAELKDALDSRDTQVRVNATVLLFDLFSHGYAADEGYVSHSLARASTDADPALRQYALVTLDSVLKALKQFRIKFGRAGAKHAGGKALV